MGAKEEFISLLGLKSERIYSDSELEIEFETELAHLEAYRKWLILAHANMILERKSVSEASTIDTITIAITPATNISIDSLELSSRATAAIKRMGVENLSDCVTHTRKDFTDIPIVGEKNATIIEALLAKYGLSFRDDPTSYAPNTAKETETGEREEAGEEEVIEEVKVEKPKEEKVEQPQVEEQAEEPQVKEVKTEPVVEEQSVEPIKEEPVKASAEDQCVEDSSRTFAVQEPETVYPAEVPVDVPVVDELNDSAESDNSYNPYLVDDDLEDDPNQYVYNSGDEEGEFEELEF